MRSEKEIREHIEKLRRMKALDQILINILKWVLGEEPKKKKVKKHE